MRHVSRQLLPFFCELSRSFKLTAPGGETACDMCTESKIDKGMLLFILITKKE